jgi:putative FmdB family regulatory protein
MPTYDYECDACGHTFEQFQNISEPHLTKCPACKKSKLRRLFGAGAAVVFKGSGFYQTDYRSDSYKKSAAAEKKSSDGGSSGGDSKASSDGASKSSGESAPTAKSDSASPKPDSKSGKKGKGASGDS